MDDWRQPGRTPATLDFGRIWQAADKIVYSKSRETFATRKTRLEREFDPQVVRGLKSELHHEVAVGGPTLAAHAIRAGLVDEDHLFVTPVILGGGKPVLPGNVRVTLELLYERGIDEGMVYLLARSRSLSPRSIRQPGRSWAVSFGVAVFRRFSAAPQAPRA